MKPPERFRSKLNLCILLLVFFSLLAFFVKVKVPWLLKFDQGINSIVYSWNTSNLTQLAEFLTHIADYRFLLPLAVFAGVLLIIFRKGIAGFVFVIIFTATRELRTFTKDIVGRTRPVEGDGYSFPSGHMMYAAFFYGYLLYLFIRSMDPEKQKKWRRPLFTVYFVLLSLIGWSRIYLKAHFASDIIGGTALGLACLLFSIILTEWLERKIIKRRLL